MVNLKNPLLSFDAHGTVGNAVTFQGGTKRKFSRQKPPRPGGVTLPRQYQRWAYRDYAYLWTQQTPAVKGLFRSNGARHHLTGFQYWMKYQLTNLLDLAAWYRLDATTGALVIDSSPNHNNGTLFGCSPAGGLIGGALSFDGFNDFFEVPVTPSLNFGIDSFTITAFVKKVDLTGDFIGKFQDRFGPGVWGISFFSNVLMQLEQEPRNPAVFFAIDDYDNSWCAYAWRINRTTDFIECYQQGVFRSQGAFVPQSFSNTLPLTVGKFSSLLLGFFGGQVDELRFYYGLLDTELIRRHALRRYVI